MDNPEVSLAASYYRLYRENSQQPKKQTEKEEEFWEEDEWTAEEEEKVQAKLDSNKLRCRVVNKNTAETSNHRENAQAWDRFYTSHQTNFFKDRHYLATTFPNEFGSSQENENPCLVELGCGVGNAMLPLLEDKTNNWTVYGVDHSQVAIDLLQKDPRFVASEGCRAHAATGDLNVASDDFPFAGKATVASLLFCLSAVDNLSVAAHHAARALRPGGVLVFRDYGRYDQAQLSLGAQRNKLLADNYYRKHDGTKCYYFSLEDLQELFVEQEGLEALELRFLKRIYRNRSTGEVRRRVWVQARFRKPKDHCNQVEVVGLK